MIKYLGSKRLLLGDIVGAISAVEGVRSVGDLFSGTSRVGHACKQAGYRVVSNDHNAYAATLARAYVEADRDDWLSDVTALVAEFNTLKGHAGYFTETFCVQSRFFQPKNGERIDAIRERIASLSLHPELEAILLVSLMEAADRVDSTTGVQMAYLKQWAARANNALELRVPALLPRAPHGKSRALQMDAEEAAATLDVDLVYLDPPYNQHKYLGNYHIWESLVLWDKPEVYGTAKKRVDCRERQSLFNSRGGCAPALRTVVEACRAPRMIVSFSDEGHVSRADIEALLATRGYVTTLSKDYKRYVGAQIGIYNPSGEKVGRVSHLRNQEYLFLVSDKRSDWEALRDAPALDRTGVTAGV